MVLMKLLVNTLAILVTISGFATAQEPTEKALHIDAGILSRDVTFENKSLKTRVRLNNETITTPESTEFSVMVSDLADNREPTGLTGLRADQKGIIKTSGDVGNGTDTLKTEGEKKDRKLERKNSITITGANAGDYFDSVMPHVSSPSAGVTRHQIRLRSIHKKRLKDVSIHLYYETYDGFPVIRKWIEVTNNSPTWRIIENLTLDGLVYVKEFSQATPLTPAERGAVSSIIAFSNADKSTGVISASTGRIWAWGISFLMAPKSIPAAWTI